MLSIILFCLSGAAVGCGRRESSFQESQSSTEEKKEGVKVERGKLVPTRSENTSITKASPFILTSPEKGVFNPKVGIGDTVEKGMVLGTVNQMNIKAPVDATIVSVEKRGKYPQNYPLMKLDYLGFSLKVDAKDFLATISDDASLKAKFQIRDVTGPENILAVVLSENEEGAPEILQCLISQDIEVKQGQNATVVITAELRDEVLLLPISVVAGRVKSGMVNQILNGTIKTTQVKLGATDGSYIEILSGLKEGDEVSPIPPNLDLREN